MEKKDRQDQDTQENVERRRRKTPNGIEMWREKYQAGFQNMSLDFYFLPVPLKSQWRLMRRKRTEPKTLAQQGTDLKTIYLYFICDKTEKPIFLLVQQLCWDRNAGTNTFLWLFDLILELGLE